MLLCGQNVAVVAPSALERCSTALKLTRRPRMGAPPKRPHVEPGVFLHTFLVFYYQAIPHGRLITCSFAICECRDTAGRGPVRSECCQRPAKDRSSWTSILLTDHPDRCLYPKCYFVCSRQMWYVLRIQNSTSISRRESAITHPRRLPYGSWGRCASPHKPNVRLVLGLPTLCQLSERRFTNQPRFVYGNVDDCR